MHEKKVRLARKSEEIEGNTGPQHPLLTLEHHQDDRSLVRLAQWYSPFYAGKLALVFELMDMNLYECLKNKKNPLTFQKIKFYMFQVLRSIEFMHRKGIFHRDIKP